MPASANPLFSAEVVYQLPFAGTIKKDIAYGEGNRLMDIYLPVNPSGSIPVVILVTGYPDAGFKTFTGIGLREIAQYTSWARLIAASGMAAVTYSNVDPVADVELLWAFLRINSQCLGLDSGRIGIWSCSGNVPNALALLNKEPTILCAVLNYGYTVDLHGATHVFDAAKSYRFVIPGIGKALVRTDVPLLLVRAGQDQFAGVNQSIDSFVTEALRRNCRIHLINYANGVHAFDVLDRSSDAQELIKAELSFLQGHLAF